MGKGFITKVMKYELQYLDGAGEFQEMQKLLWDIQKSTRAILNKTIQIAFDWDYRSNATKEQTGNYLDVMAETGYKTLDGYIYDQLKHTSGAMGGSLTNATLRKAYTKYKASKADIFRGTISLPSYKSNQPIIVPKQCITVTESAENGVVIECSLLSKETKKTVESSNGVRFELRIKDKTQRTIINRILEGSYEIGESQIVYDRPKWFLLISYSFAPKTVDVEPGRILGVDLGECSAVYASIYGEYERLCIPGGEVTAFAKKMEARRYSLQKQARVAGEGRIGHGIKTRVSAVYQAEDKIAKFRDTINHRYSKALIDFAVKTHCGVIQMEDLSGIKEDTGFPKLLRHWTYFDLQTKIENKAKEYGIVVRKIDPQYTSQRCSKCGHISKDNRLSQANFKCEKCGYAVNADFNASQNLSIEGIDRIIQGSLGANPEGT